MRLAGGRYLGSATPPDVSSAWTALEPLTARELVDELRQLGCHTTDIAEAFHEANPNWLEEVD
jgi:hypothetical protein